MPARGRKKIPREVEDGDVRICLLQRERRKGEREGKALRNTEVVQETQCCVAETERARFTSVEGVRHKPVLM